MFVKMSSLYQFEKLDNDNYDSWCVQMLSVFVHSGYWKIVNGSLKRKSLMDAKAKEAWNENDKRALTSITLCVKVNQLNGSKNCSSSTKHGYFWTRHINLEDPSRKCRCARSCTES